MASTDFFATDPTAVTKPVPNPTAALALWAAGLGFDDIPVAVRERARDLLTDAVACALAADRAEEMGAIDAFADVLGRAPEAAVIGRPERRSAAGASLVNGYRITALTACDVYTPAHFHVTPEVVPPALAVAEAVRGGGRVVAGADLLVALVAGFEAATRVAAGLRYPSFRARGWHTPGIAGPFGGAAAAGRLLGLDAVALRNAFGLAGSQSAGTFAAWGTPTVKFHQARGSMAGLLAAQLASTGFSAADDVLANPDGGLLSTYSDGGDPEAVTSALGERWELMRISVRPWPGATPLQPVITGLFRLLAAGVIGPASSDPLRIVVAPSVYAQHARFRHPTGTFEAMLSIDYTAAVVLAHGRLGFDEFMPAVYSRPDLAAVIDRRIELAADADLTPLECRLELGGATPAIERVSVPKGHPDDPADPALLEAKFRACAEGVLDSARADQLLGDLGRLELLSDVGSLLGGLGGSAR